VRTLSSLIKNSRESDASAGGGISPSIPDIVQDQVVTEQVRYRKLAYAQMILPGFSNHHDDGKIERAPGLASTLGRSWLEGASAEKFRFPVSYGSAHD